MWSRMFQLALRSAVVSTVWHSSETVALRATSWWLLPILAAQRRASQSRKRALEWLS